MGSKADQDVVKEHQTQLQPNANGPRLGNHRSVRRPEVERIAVGAVQELGCAGGGRAFEADDVVEEEKTRSLQLKKERRPSWTGSESAMKGSW